MKPRNLASLAGCDNDNNGIDRTTPGGGTAIGSGGYWFSMEMDADAAECIFLERESAPK